MVEQGATTIWERWDSYTKEDAFGRHNAEMNSFAHYSFGAVYQWIVENAGGIRMADVAYGKLRIEPRPGGGVTWANTRYDSVRGPIATSWRIGEASRESGGLPYPLVPLLKSVLVVMPAALALQGLSLGLRSVRALSLEPGGER